jgi:hypothetical protein
MSLSLSPLCGLLIRSGVPCVNVGLLVCFNLALYNLNNFVEIEGYLVSQLVEAPRCKIQGRGFYYQRGHWINFFLPATISPCK